MDRIGLEQLSLFGMPPPQVIALARQLGCDYAGLHSIPLQRYNPHNYPAWTFEDPVIRRETRAAAKEHGVTISLCEGFTIHAEHDISSLAEKLDIVPELECKRINTISMDMDLSRTLDQFAALTEMAEARGLETVIEIGGGPISTIEAARAALSHVGRPSFKLLLDTMHYFRFAKASVADAAALPPGAIGYVQICDAPWAPRGDSYMREALYERMAPGEGELPLRELLPLIPDDVIIGVEVPRRSLADAGVSPFDRMKPCIDAARKLTADAKAKH